MNLLIVLVVRVFANDPENQDLIPGHVIPKTLKMVLDPSLLNTQKYKVCIKGKVEQSRERSSALPYGRQKLLYVYNFLHYLAVNFVPDVI